MKKFILFFLLSPILFSCNTGRNAPDVSNIKVDIQLDRFDLKVFNMDTTGIEKSLSDLYVNYPSLYPIFIQNILGLDDTSQDEGMKRFIKLNHFIADSVQNVFNRTAEIENEFENAFKYVKYYFPFYKIPKIITIVGPPDVLAKTVSGEPTPDFIGPDFLGISLQFYLGKNFSLYHDDYFIANVAPEFRSRRFDKKYIIADAMKLVADDIYPDNSINMGLIEQMIEKGKQWLLLDKFLPFADDSIITGYTKQQLKWCEANEGLIWNEIITTEKDIYTKEPLTIQNYIGEAPFTQSMSSASPGNIGQWVGWQIVKKFAEKNSSLSITDILKTSPRKILELAKYKPK